MAPISVLVFVSVDPACFCAVLAFVDAAVQLLSLFCSCFCVCRCCLSFLGEYVVRNATTADDATPFGVVVAAAVCQFFLMLVFY